MQQERDDIVEPTGASAPGGPSDRVDLPHTVGSPVEHFYATSPRPEDHPASYALPEPPEGSGPVRWVPPGQPVTVAGVTIQGGMLYVGSRELLGDITTRRNKLTSVDDKRAWYAAFRTYVHNQGQKPGQAAHLYRERFGVWPRFGEVGYGHVFPDAAEFIRQPD